MENKDILRALENNCIYDFIAVNYWKLTKEQLRDLALELSYQLITNGNERQVIKDLKERWEV